MLGALSSRTFGIYFLMLTLTYAVIGYYVFGQVATISGFGGITGIDPPSLLDGPLRLYYLALGFSVLAYVGFRAIRRTPFGVALEGVRDDPVRMASLGFHVPLHRTLAFTLAGFVAAIAGVINVWWNGQIDPNTVSIGETIDLLIVAVIGGIGRLEGAWLGRPRVRRRQQLPPRSAVRRQHRADRSAVQHRRRPAGAGHRRAVAGRTDGSARASAQQDAETQAHRQFRSRRQTTHCRTALPNTS